MRIFVLPAFNPRIGGNNMAGKKLTMTLTNDQQKKIREATGKSLSELTIDLAALDHLGDEDLDRVVGGVLKRDSDH
jgi:hypothetical protein